MKSKQALQIQLEEAIQMLRLVASQKRTCMEIQEWLDQNYPENMDNDSESILSLIIKNTK